MLVVIYAKILNHSFIPTIYENFKPVFLLIYCKRKFKNLYTGLIRVIERIEAVLWYFHWIIFKQMDITSKMQNIMFTENYYIWPNNFDIAVNCNETGTRKV